MTSHPDWTKYGIKDELDYIRQWGKSEVRAYPSMTHKDPWDAQTNPDSPCGWGICDCKPESYLWIWDCWCSEGQGEESWEKAMEELEWHMWGGCHK